MHLALLLVPAFFSIGCDQKADDSETPDDAVSTEDSISGTTEAPDDTASTEDSTGDTSVAPDDTAITRDSTGDTTEPIDDTGTTGDSAGSTTEPIEVELTCESYCALMEANCMEDMLHPIESCLLYCDPSKFEPHPLGEEGDTSGNSLACRIHWAEAAGHAESETARLSACASAHASGGDVCGDYCENYCHVSGQVCTEENTGLDNYSSDAACRLACDGFATDVLDGISQTEQHFGYGDTVQCRLHHLEAALIEGAESAMAYNLHCPHASQRSSLETCSDSATPNVTNYCAFATTACGEGSANLFPDKPEDESLPDYCSSQLNALVDAAAPSYREDPFESFADTATNSLGCLNYWIMLAPLDPETYCPLADWDPEHWESAGGAGVCDL